jgi:hypothetical protein
VQPDFYHNLFNAVYGIYAKNDTTNGKYCTEHLSKLITFLSKMHFKLGHTNSSIQQQQSSPYFATI